MFRPVATRGSAPLDRIATNINEEETTVKSYAALQDIAGTESDHKILIADHRTRHVHMFKKVKIRHRKMTEEGDKKFATMINGEDWSEVMVQNADEAANALEKILEGMLDECYPWSCLLYTSPSPRDLSTSRMPSSA